MESILKRYFGYSSFRPYQKDIIEKVLDGRDCLVVMATGSGKSLCYQIPPLISGKTAIIISPLLSLMQDQVMSLKRCGIKAEYLGSTQTDQKAQSEAESGRFDILYMTPEKACVLPSRFWERLLNVGICLLAVDEAHCISEWGHDFRREYKRLYTLRDNLSRIPFLALTATATMKVQADIINSLKLDEPYITIGSFDRGNLFYGVKSITSTLSFLNELTKEVSNYAAKAGSTIVYCMTVKDTEQVYESLQNAGIKAGIYHGKMGSKAREMSHSSFVRDELQVMVATIAFGMGIDKPNVRCVIHYGCPKNIESYYQESGRCGRDGLASVCWLYYSRSDFQKANYWCAEAESENQRKAIMESFMAAEKYCLVATCRRKFLLGYFGEEYNGNCGNCDNCTRPSTERDLSRESYLLLSCVRSCGDRWGLNMPIDILRGSRAKKILENNFDKLQFHSLGRDYSSTWWKSLASQLIAHGYLKENFQDVFRTVSVSSDGEQFLRKASDTHQPSLLLALTSEMIDEENNNSLSKTGEGLQGLPNMEFREFSVAETKFYNMLLDVRKKIADETGSAPYAVCSDQVIKKITKRRPSTRPRLANIDGVNQQLVEEHGDRLLQSIIRLSEELNLTLDGDAAIQTATTKKVYPVAQKKLTPAKFNAWRMWQQEGLSFENIANTSERSAPIKEGTVVSYILDAAREGLEINWSRLCKEMGLTLEMVSQICCAIIKAGSRDKLKPIKDELPDNELGSLPEELMEGADSLSSKCPIKSESPLPHNQDCCEGAGKGPNQMKDTGERTEASLSLDAKCNAVETVAPCDSGACQAKQSRPSDTPADESSPKKLRRHCGTEGKPFEEVEASEGSIMEWLKDHDGVSSADIMNHFQGSEEEFVVDLLGSLESQFLIFKKNNLYRLM